MLLFKVFLNGKLVSTAGAPDLSVLSHMVTAVGRLGPDSQGASGQKEGVRLELRTSGMTSRASSPSNIHITWVSEDDLKVGDEVTVKILEGAKADMPYEPEVEAIEDSREREAELERQRFEYAKKFYFENRHKYEG